MSVLELFEKSKLYVPGGVHSPVRSFKGLDIPPRFVKEAKGAYFTDTEGKNYIDFCMSFGPLILGHAAPQVKEELIKALERGWSYGACEPYSLELAEFILGQLQFGEQIRFVNSGTEAVMTALRLARGFTGKSKILKFNGCYHGHVDSMLIKAGSGLAGTAEASSAGVPAGISKDTLIVELGDQEAVNQCFAQFKDEIAAVIIEPLPANNGLMIQEQKFLEFLRKECKANNALLIFDEVISGFRVGFQGMVKETKITPDIVTYGKIIGGGLPVGAIVSTKEIMETLAPLGPVYQAGTLSANPLAMIGGLATLKQCTEENYEKIQNQTDKLLIMFKRWLDEFNHGQFKKYNIIQKSSLFWLVPNVKNISRIDQIPENLTLEFHDLFSTLLTKGVYLSPNAYEVGFCSLAHDDEVLAQMEKRLWS